MTENSGRAAKGMVRAYWVAAGFLGAFLASVLTVVYTGLMVEGSRSEFDVGFRSVTLTVGATSEVELYFDAEVNAPDARLEIELPAGIAMLVDGPASRPVAIRPGVNRFAIRIAGTEAGQGYIVARISADAPVGLERVFLTVAAAAGD